MKLTGILCLIAFLHVSAGSHAQTVTYTAKTTPLVNVFSAIEQQTGYVFFYNSRDLQGAGPVTVQLEKTPLKEALEKVLSGQPLSFDIQGNTIVITRKAQPDVQSQAAPPPGDIHGRVLDSLGNPLGGASVFVKGTKKGVSTDAHGNFDLKGVDSKAILVISFTGFESQEVRLDGRNTISVQLKQGATQLLDVVVNKGYYSTTERLNTGDVTTVSGATINQQPVSDPILALEGRVPGLYIQQASGVPGAYSQIHIQGQNSITNGNDPFYIVDGVPFTSVSLSVPNFNYGAAGNSSATYNSAGGGISPFNSLNPADIESIVVLKDADATSIYGSRGANGVILITTRQGKAGRTRLDLNVYTGGGVVTRMMPMLNTSQYLAMRREAYEQDGLAIPSIVTNNRDRNYDINGVWDTNRYTNWQKVLIGNTANFTNFQGTVSGGSANTQFLVGGGYSDQGTAYIGHYYDQKISGHINFSHLSTDQNFSLQFGANYIYDNDYLPQTDFTGTSVKLAPDAPALYEPNGNLNWQDLNGVATFNNPAALTLKSNRAVTDNLISNLNLRYQLLPGLNLKTSLGYNHIEMNEVSLSPASEEPPPYNDEARYRSSSFSNQTNETWIIEPQLNYQREIGDGRLDILTGSTFQQNALNSSGEEASGFASDALINDPLAASTIVFPEFSKTLYRYTALYGRVAYNWEEKYLINITARRDGSSRFGPGKQFGNFGAAGIGWIFSKENVIQDHLACLSFGKLRVSYGSTGNDQITDYQYLSTYTPVPNSSTYEGLTGLYPTSISNPYFAWEVDKKLEGGIDLGFLHDHILLSASYYRNRTGNLLIGYNLPYLSGFNNIEANFPAVVQNTGVELTLNTANIKTKTFSWTTNVNFTLPSNKLAAFQNITTSSYANRYVVGKSLFIQEEFHNTGVNPQTGLYSFETKDPNGPDFPKDLKPTKPITQKYYGGIDNKFSYEGFELDIFVQFVDQLGYNVQDSYSSQPGVVNQNEPTTVLNRWQTPGDLTNNQRFGTNGTTANAFYNFQISDGVITNTSFLRLKNFALAYQLPTNWKSKCRLQNARIYLQCQNLITITGYKGIDPETGSFALPPLRMITAGLQIGF
jgi:TonB-linked SusC/RagA family outer membrane protein